MSVETFFHARPSSPLLRGITDDDFITWFDKTELASLKTNANIDNICECGRICSRDYEFKKPHVNKVDTNTEQNDIDTSTASEETTTTTEDITSEKTVAEDITTRQSHDTTELATSAAFTTTYPMAENHVTTKNNFEENHESTIATEITTTNVIITETEIEANPTISSNNITLPKDTTIDDPIIIPTVTFVNKTNVDDMSNNIEPLASKVQGELIYQKSAASKTIIKKENQTKKPLIRRKGTLKATYGDKHDKLFFLAEEVATKSTLAVEVIKILSTQMTSAPVENKKAIIHTVLLNKTKTDDKLIPDTTIHSLPANLNSSNTMSTATEQTHLDKTEVDKTTSSIDTHATAHSGALTHTITTITKNNIKSMHYRTKKPKAITQIKKPPLRHIIEKVMNTTDGIIIDMENNKTKKKTIATEKYTTKTLKSINKEIHKIPPTPISETSKSLSEPPKSDIAPENKGSFEILDKNNLGWELLKEGSYVDVTKVDDKLQNRLNLIEIMSNATQNDNRSL